MSRNTTFAVVLVHIIAACSSSPSSPDSDAANLSEVDGSVEAAPVVYVSTQKKLWVVDGDSLAAGGLEYTEVGSFGDGSFGIGNIAISRTGKMVGFSSNAGAGMYQIDVATGAATRVADFDQFWSMGGATFLADGRLIVQSSDGSFYDVDPNTGSRTFLTKHIYAYGAPDLVGSGDGRLFAVLPLAENNVVATIDLATGLETKVIGVLDLPREIPWGMAASGGKLYLFTPTGNSFELDVATQANRQITQYGYEWTGATVAPTVSLP